jgi:hypothetical protein
VRYTKTLLLFIESEAVMLHTLVASHVNRNCSLIGRAQKMVAGAAAVSESTAVPRFAPFDCRIGDGCLSQARANIEKHRTNVAGENTQAPAAICHGAVMTFNQGCH